MNNQIDLNRLNDIKEFITKEQFPINPPLNTHYKPKRWKVNGKVKTWKTRPNEFKIPVKFGLYNFGYVTHENISIFNPVYKNG